MEYFSGQIPRIIHEIMEIWLAFGVIVEFVGNPWEIRG
jgi:hypothetical protein